MSKMQKNNNISVPNRIQIFVFFGGLINQKPQPADRPFQAKVGIYKLNQVGTGWLMVLILNGTVRRAVPGGSITHRHASRASAY